MAIRENVVYLDFDGVMRTGREEALHTLPPAEAALVFLREPLVALAETCQIAQSSVVLSTSWRGLVTPQAWRSAWQAGLVRAGRAELPVPELFRQRMRSDGCWKTPDYGWIAARGGEIRDHLHVYGPHIRAWAIADDIPDMMLAEQRPRVVASGPDDLFGESHKQAVLALLR